MFQIEVADKIKTHIFCLITFSEDRTFCEMMSKNMVEPETPEMTTWCMRFACWIKKAT